MKMQKTKRLIYLVVVSQLLILQNGTAAGEDVAPVVAIPELPPLDAPTLPPLPLPLPGLAGDLPVLPNNMSVDPVSGIPSISIQPMPDTAVPEIQANIPRTGVSVDLHLILDPQLTEVVGPPGEIIPQVPDIPSVSIDQSLLDQGTGQAQITGPIFTEENSEATPDEPPTP